MDRLDLNLASRPFRNNTLIWVGMVLAVFLLGSWSAWNVRSYQRHTVLLDDLLQQVGTIEEQVEEYDTREQRARTEIGRVDLDLLATRAEKANEVLRWKSFSWTRLFNRLQEVLPWDVQMTSIRPSFRIQRTVARNRVTEDPERVPIAVDGIAKTIDDLFMFEAQLLADPGFTRIRPERQERDDVSGEIVFRMNFLYDPRVGEGPADLPEADEDVPDAEQVAARAEEQAAEVTQ